MIKVKTSSKIFPNLISTPSYFFGSPVQACPQQRDYRKWSLYYVLEFNKHAPPLIKALDGLSKM